MLLRKILTWSVLLRFTCMVARSHARCSLCSATGRFSVGLMYPAGMIIGSESLFTTSWYCSVCLNPHACRADPVAKGGKDIDAISICKESSSRSFRPIHLKAVKFGSSLTNQRASLGDRSVLLLFFWHDGTKLTQIEQENVESISSREDRMPSVDGHP